MEQWTTNVEKNFSNAAHKYNHHNAIQKHAAETLLEHCPSQDITRILEIGCGTGTLTQCLIQKYPDAQYHITDLSPAMLKKARTTPSLRNHAIQWDIMDADNPTSNQKYDLIISNMVLQWCEDKDQALESLSRLLTPNGKLIFSIPGPRSFHEWRSILSKLGHPSGFLDFSPPSKARIIKEEEITIDYENGYAFLKNLKNIGAHKPKKGYRPLSPKALKATCRLFDQVFHGEITWHILYGEYNHKLKTH